MAMKYITEPTTWYEHGNKIEVPAGESVTTLAVNQIPVADRSYLAGCLAAYAARERYMTAIKIRDWYAIIETRLLTDHYVVLPVDDVAKCQTVVAPADSSPTKPAKKRQTLFS